MKLTDKIRLHKDNGISLTILSVLLIFTFSINTYRTYQTYGTTDYLIPFILTTVGTLSLLLVIYLLEHKGATFSSHFMLLSLFSGNYIRLFLIGGRVDVITNIEIILGVIISVYIILKLLTHFEDLRMYSRKPNVHIISAIGVTLLRVYYNSGFDRMGTYFLIIFTILLSLNSKEVLLISLAVFFQSTLSSVQSLMFYSQTTLEFINNGLNVAINVFIIVYLLNTYRNDNSDNFYEYYN